MGELLFCNEPIASMPYFIEGIALNVYSLEELSFYILQNTYLIERNFMCEELCTWLEEDLKVEALGEELRDIIKNNGSLLDFVKSILTASGYCTSKEISQVCQVVSEMQNKSEFECRKLRADRLMEKEKYLSSIYGYKQLLELEDAKAESPIILGNIWHNLGCAYARLFLFQEAESCFCKAYDLNGNQESLRQRLFCFCCMGDEEGFMQAASSYSLDEMQIREIQNEMHLFTKNPETAIFEQWIEDLLFLKEQGKDREYQDAVWKRIYEWKEDYRRICRM